MANLERADADHSSDKSRKARRDKGSPPAGGRPPTTLHDVPDKLLELILCRLTSSSLWLVRAAATCRRWRRIVTHKDFLVGSRPEHPVIAGHYHCYHHCRPRHPPSSLKVCSRLAFVPSSPEPVGCHFSLDFLPGGSSRWELVSSRGSLLLAKKRSKSGRWMRHCFPDLVLCEPATRQHRVIPRMEEMKYHHCLGVFLHHAESMTWFRVTCVVYQPYFGVSEDVGAVKVFVFSEGFVVGGDSWCSRESTITTRPCRGIRLRCGMDSVRFLGHACGSAFWAIDDEDDSLVAISEYIIEVEVLHLPDGLRASEMRAIVDGGGNVSAGNVRVVSLEGSTLAVATWVYDNGPADEVVLEGSLRLVEATCGLAGYKEGYFRGGAKVVTASSAAVVLTPAEEETWMVSVNLETMEVAECRRASETFPSELPWPPTLRACAVSCRRWGYGRCSHICVC